MRILLTVHQFLPRFTSGTEVLTLQTAHALTKAGHDVRVLSGSPRGDDISNGRRFSYVHQDVMVYVFEQRPRSHLSVSEWIRNEYDDASAAEVLREIVADWRPDIIHAFHLQRLSGSIISAAIGLGVPCTFTPTDFWAICPLNQLRLDDGVACSGPTHNSTNCIRHFATLAGSGKVGAVARVLPETVIRAGLAIGRHVPPEWRPSLVTAATELQERPNAMRKMLSAIDKIIAPSELMVRKLVDFGVNRDSIVKIGYGIDESCYLTRASSKGRGSKTKFGFIGTFYFHKAPHVLIDAVRMLPMSLDFDVLLFGSEGYFPSYSRMLRDRAQGDSRIRFCGEFPFSQLAGVLGEIDVLVVPSTWLENTPLVVYSAQAAGVPVLASRVEGISEIVTDGHDGRLFKAGDAVELSGIIQEFASDKSLAGKLARFAPYPSTISEYAAQLESVYAEFLH